MIHLSGGTSVWQGVTLVHTICHENVIHPSPATQKLEGLPPCDSMPFGVAWAYYLLSSSIDKCGIVKW